MTFRFGFSAIVLVLLLAIGGCKLVKYSDDPARTGSASGTASLQGQDAESGLVEMWDEKVVPHFRDEATDLAVLLPAIRSDLDAAGKEYGHRQEGGFGAWNFATRLTGVIVAANTETRAATAGVDIDDDDIADATLQLGPVIRGTSVRDTLPFIDFSDYRDQIAFAQLSRSLNGRAYETALKDLDREGLVGQRIAVSGAMSLTAADEDVLITPVVVSKGGNQ
ncbi:DUF2291 family protein [Oricola thermophila]|uniref:DUF2291 domain-containing protein n=1 Tax=Oricola thermophila TaxID=2742145 RepID=A0A6N1VHR4_9HYPH|nr:DUF2291 domain-containing protein [Oricola thermophila]QKV18537.1 DUF2291 domain-containing protein [Oricola thermophila]